MEWIPIDRENLPKGEVLLTVASPNGIGDFWVGCVYWNDVIGPYSYDRSIHAKLPTHYFDPKTIKIPQNQSLN